jgi:hypothetical protein
MSRGPVSFKQRDVTVEFIERAIHLAGGDPAKAAA